MLMHLSLALLLCFGTVCAAPTAQEVFTEIYANKVWGKNSDGLGTSGFGSTEKNTRIYRQFLQDFLKAYDIHSVVDVGCGDWEFTRLMNWDGINYLGFDVVEQVIKRNCQLYQNDHIHFVHGNAVELDLPQADLLICKDVLQHIPNRDIKKLIAQFDKFKYCLITNEVDPITRQGSNEDTKPMAQARTIDLTAAPFNLKGKKILSYRVKGFVKQVLLITREDAR
jgi:SAM-dependent methyltransferase